MIGVFDSGLGGLSVVREILRLDPGAHILYLGDRSWAPYGVRSLAEVRRRAVTVTEHLLDGRADTIVVACNTASAAALTHLRLLHPERSFVGMEPAVKPAVSMTRSGIIGVLATPATFQGALYASVVDRYAVGVDVMEVPCPGWMEMVEHPMDDAERRATIERTVAPLVAAGADVLVLGCTHYPFLRSDIEEVAGPGVTVVDPGEAVARQVIRTAVPDRRRGVRITVTGPVDGVADRIRSLVGLDLPVESVTFPDSDI
ncbi:MAG TPA: glutamate racemase [Acidimicrobiia bacterium]|nr:glutamate racemase [Acidimicrobiia bacterium]